MSTYKKPVHELCIDKTSCKREGELKPTANLTKDYIRKSYQAERQKSDDE